MRVCHRKKRCKIMYAKMASRCLFLFPKTQYVGGFYQTNTEKITKTLRSAKTQRNRKKKKQRSAPNTNLSQKPPNLPCGSWSRDVPFRLSLFLQDLQLRCNLDRNGFLVDPILFKYGESENPKRGCKDIQDFNRINSMSMLV